MIDLKAAVHQLYYTPISLDTHRRALPCLVALVGSHNYGLSTETSDLDLKVGYYPDFEDLVNNSCPIKKVVTDNIEYTVAPIHHLVKYALRGNLNFIEPWITKYCCLNTELQELRTNLQKLFIYNPMPFFNSQFGMAHQSINSKSGNLNKKACHAMLSLYLINHFFYFNVIDFEALPTETLKKIKSGQISREIYLEMYHGIDTFLKGILTKDKITQLHNSSKEQREHLLKNIETKLLWELREHAQIYR